ncbi:ABC transporter ATP-binding protein [Clostridium cellulovorans]|uniref:ABC transporter related n=1 Tax=Clostridium cellulovorans (strain ATCC 35296 / DSM 3052 / OCM 3 / 743B) TaxID=573061 RepID=D9SP48_CLOC7|nr:ABC transporter ATP-binding protein [Clostridium cellulovorans]ADL52013.1 ABC transporter related [Clostridium cellulovorans 743B]
MSFYKKLNELLNHLDKKKAYIFFTFASCATFIGFRLIMSIVNQQLIDGVMSNDNISNEITITIIGVVLSCCSFPIFMYFRGKIIRNSIMKMRLSIFRQALNLPQSYYDNHNNSDVMMYYTYNINSMEETYGEPIRAIVNDIMFGVCSIVMIFIINIKMVLVNIALGILLLSVNVFFNKYIEKSIKLIYDRYNVVLSDISEIYSGIKDIKVFNISEYIYENFLENNKKYETESINLNKIQSSKEGIGYFFKMLNFIFLLFYGSFLVKDNLITIGDMVMVILLHGSIATMFLTIGGTKGILQQAFTCSDALNKFYLEATEKELLQLASHKRSTKDSDCNYSVLFKNVSFNYGNANFQFNNLNLKIQKGEKVALVGYSGSGKSTFIKLVMGLYIPCDGKIFINNQLIYGDNIENIRDDISYIPQDKLLFSGTFEENIRYGNSKITISEIEHICKLVGLHDYIQLLPDKYNSFVGEHGCALSGGQKQRITIARALVKRASILIFDEPTSALDIRNTESIMKIIENLPNEITVIIVAHKLHCMEFVDNIHVFDKGHIIESGNHTELINKKGVYYDLYKSNNKKDEVFI